MNKLHTGPVPTRARDVRVQLGALCYRIRNGKPQVLLVTSRSSRRWVIPKGWPIPGHTTGAAALREAWEEAGVVGKLTGDALGLYTYSKSRRSARLILAVAVYPVKVKRLEDSFPETRQRRRKWMSPKKAAARVAEPELRQIILRFAAAMANTS